MTNAKVAYLQIVACFECPMSLYHIWLYLPCHNACHPKKRKPLYQQQKVHPWNKFLSSATSPPARAGFRKTSSRTFYVSMRKFCKTSSGFKSLKVIPGKGHSVLILMYFTIVSLEEWLEKAIELLIMVSIIFKNKARPAGN